MANQRDAAQLRRDDHQLGEWHAHLQPETTPGNAQLPSAEQQTTAAPDYQTTAQREQWANPIAAPQLEMSESTQLVITHHDMVTQCDTGPADHQVNIKDAHITSTAGPCTPAPTSSHQQKDTGTTALDEMTRPGPSIKSTTLSREGLSADSMRTLPPAHDAGCKDHTVSGYQEDSSQHEAEFYTRQPEALPAFLVNMECPVAPDERRGIDVLQEDMDGQIMDETFTMEASHHGGAVPMMDVSRWPFPNPHMARGTARIYDIVRSTGRHNHEEARIPLPSALNLTQWRQEATGHEMDHVIMAGLEFGFPLQYCGPPQFTAQVPDNHASAVNYMEHLHAYTEEEVRHGALEGPFTKPPFVPWCVTSPLMTREKNDSSSRRIIVDLLFPDGGINKYIIPHVFNGKEATHNLPTIEAAVDTIAHTCPGQIRLSVIDLSRAYRQFPISPLDWPLLTIKVGTAFFFDRRLPFGARMSSYTMQIIADFIIRALQKRKINAHMYLDDIIVISPTPQVASRQYEQVLGIIRDLGLQAATKKLQPPSTKIRWLGINFDVEQGILSIPVQKLQDIKRCLAAAAKRETLSKKQLQRIIGSINHLAKVVRAARLFIARILAAYRAATGDRVSVTRQVKADFKWFARYLSSANGRAIIPHNRVVLRVWADACLEGAGASDGENFYSFKFPAATTKAHHITHLEALNCVAAARAFVSNAHAGGIVEVHCDNRPAVDAFKSGRARDPILAACARAIWFQAAHTDTTIRFTHVPGEAMALPDALSRVYRDKEHRDLANELVKSLRLKATHVTPDMFSYAAFL